MSLVITAWDKSVGIAVCDGRACGHVDGKRAVVSEDYSKLARLPNGGVLGFAGRLRAGYPVSNLLADVLTDHLIPAVTLASRDTGFRGLCDFIPNQLKQYAARWPDVLLFVSLLGTDEGVVRGGSWDSDGEAVVPMTSAVTWQILGPAELSAQADMAVRASLSLIGGLRNPIVAGESLQNIIRALATISDEINDHTLVEFIRPEVTALTADLITTGTLDASAVDVVNIDASNISTGTLSASKVLFPDGSALTTASRVLTSQINGTAVSAPSGSTTAIPGLGWSVTAAGSSDTFNLNGVVNMGPSGANITFKFLVCVDGNTSTDYGSGAVYYMPGTSSEEPAFPFFGSVTGLSAGAHTIQVYIAPLGGAGDAGGSWALCQRIY